LKNQQHGPFNESWSFDCPQNTSLFAILNRDASLIPSSILGKISAYPAGDVNNFPGWDVSIKLPSDQILIQTNGLGEIKDEGKIVKQKVSCIDSELYSDIHPSNISTYHLFIQINPENITIRTPMLGYTFILPTPPESVILIGTPWVSKQSEGSSISMNPSPIPSGKHCIDSSHKSAVFEWVTGFFVAAMVTGVALGGIYKVCKGKPCIRNLINQRAARVRNEALNEVAVQKILDPIFSKKGDKGFTNPISLEPLAIQEIVLDSCLPPNGPHPWGADVRRWDKPTCPKTNLPYPTPFVFTPLTLAQQNAA